MKKVILEDSSKKRRKVCHEGLGAINFINRICASLQNNEASCWLMAEEKESSLTKLRSMLISTSRILISKLQPPPPPLLPVVDSHPIIQNLERLELGKLAFTLATTAILGLLFSHKFPAAHADYFIVVGFMGSCATLWNGILFGKIYLQVLGISLCLLSLCGLLGSLLPHWLFRGLLAFRRSLPRPVSLHSLQPCPSPARMIIHILILDHLMMD